MEEMKNKSRIGKLTPAEIQGLTYGFNEFADIDFYEAVNEHGVFEGIKDELRKSRVIEIGPGKNPVNKEWFCKEYIGVQPHKVINPDNTLADYVYEDGLTFLRKQPDDSAIVVALGVLEKEILNFFFEREMSDLGERYLVEISEEIKRVANPLAVIYGMDAKKYFGEPNLFKSHVGGIYLFKD